MREEFFLARAVALSIYSERVSKPSWAIIRAATSHEAARIFLNNEAPYLEDYGDFRLEVKPFLNDAGGVRVDVERKEIVTVKWEVVQ